MRPICTYCDKGNLRKPKKGRFLPYCSSCEKKLYEKTKRKRKYTYRPPQIKFQQHPYRKHKKTYCEECGWIATHRCQLDVDHIDGNHSNNHPDNLQTLCANCHRLKTYKQRNP